MKHYQRKMLGSAKHLRLAASTRVLCIALILFVASLRLAASEDGHVDDSWAEITAGIALLTEGDARKAAEEFRKSGNLAHRKIATVLSHLSEAYYEYFKFLSETTEAGKRLDKTKASKRAHAHLGRALKAARSEGPPAARDGGRRSPQPGSSRRSRRGAPIGRTAPGVLAVHAKAEACQRPLVGGGFATVRRLPDTARRIRRRLARSSPVPDALVARKRYTGPRSPLSSAMRTRGRDWCSRWQAGWPLSRLSLARGKPNARNR